MVIDDILAVASKKIEGLSAVSQGLIHQFEWTPEDFRGYCNKIISLGKEVTSVASAISIKADAGSIGCEEASALYKFLTLVCNESADGASSEHLKQKYYQLADHYTALSNILSTSLK